MRSPGNIARGDQGWDQPAQRPLVGLQPLHVLHLDEGLFIRQEVADAGGEDVGTLLLQQRGAVPRRDGVVILSKRLFALLDDALDPPAVADHGEPAERRLGRQRKRIHRLDGLLLSVLVALPNCDPGMSAVYLPANSHPA